MSTTYYMIDFDSGNVLYKCKVKSIAEGHIKTNELELAVTLITSADDLVLEFSVKELTRIYKTLTNDNGYKNLNEEELAERVFNTIQAKEYKIKTLLKTIKEPNEDLGHLSKDAKKAPAKKAKAKAKPATKKAPAKKKVNKLEGVTLELGETKPPKGRHTKIANFIEDNLDEATYEELEEYLISDGTKDPAPHIRWAVTKDIIRVKE